MSKPEPDISSLLPDDATLKARRAELVGAVGQPAASPGGPGWRRRGTRLALGAGIAAAVIAVALAVSSGGDNPSKAFAVEPQEDGGVTIRVHSLEDPNGLEAALADAGIPSQINWLPAGTTCREPHFTPSQVKSALGGKVGGMGGGGSGEPLTIGVLTTEQYRERRRAYMRGEISSDEYYNSTGNISLDPEEFRPGQSVVISGSPSPYSGDPEGGFVYQFAIAKGPVDPCEQVPAPPSGNDPFGHPTAGGGPSYFPVGDHAQNEAVAASDLRQAAIAARADETQVEEPPGPGEYLYVKTKVVHLEAWDPDNPSGEKAKPRYFTDRQLRFESAMPALVATLKEVWTAPDGTTHERETLDRVDFLSGADQERWEEAGSPPPFAYDPGEHTVGRDDAGRPVKDYASRAFRGRREFAYLSKLSMLPTEPEALRLAIENRGGGGSPAEPSPAATPRGGATVQTLLEILSEPIAATTLRAAAFGALAEIPGLGFERGVTDAAGREGDAIAWVRERGFGQRYIFDPDTGKVLSDAEMIFDAEPSEYRGIPDDTVFRETAHLQTGITGSDEETATTGGRAG